MNTRFTLVICGLIGLSASSFAVAPVELGQITLNSVAYTSGNGTFEWNVANSNTSLFTANSTIYTYCMSLNNVFSPAEPQTYNVWTIAGASAADVQASGMLSNNNMVGLTPTSFLEAAAQAQSFGSNYGITAADNANNVAIHVTESNGDTSFDSMDYSRFYYLQQANPDNLHYAGQPQGFVAPPVPEPASMATLAIGAVALLRRRKKA